MGELIVLRSAVAKNSRAARIFEAQQRREAAIKQAEMMIWGALATTSLMMVTLSVLVWAS